MFSYELLKWLHIVSAFVFVGYALLSLHQKAHPMVVGILATATLIVGFALLPYTGVKHWVWGKVFIWVAIMGFVGVISKRFPQRAPVAAWGLYTLVAMAVYLAVYKPG